MEPVPTPGSDRGERGRGERSRSSALQSVVIATAALLTVLPLLLHGCSCGHDFSFHLQNWMEVDSQWRAGILWPRWDLHAAWNAGEPRLLFYPPLSWLLGASLGRILPLAAVPAAYTFVALLFSGLTMRRLVQRWASPTTATLAGCLYLANPYMLFVAYERTAYAELLAAAWMPLLLAAALRSRADPLRIALAVALLWLTNAPAAVVGCYTLLLLSLFRLVLLLRRGTPARDLLLFAGRLCAGTFLGLAAAAVYILPAASERRFVQISMAVIEGMRPADNFLFSHTRDALHDQVLRTASLNATGFLLLALLAVLLFFVRARRGHSSFSSMRRRDMASSADRNTRHTVTALSAYSALVLLLLLPVSGWVWRHAPELAFLQFPWRFLSAESGVAILLLAFVLPSMRVRAALPAALLFALCAGLFADRLYRQPCDEEDAVAAQQQAFRNGTGTEPTDEYTPADADNDALAHDDPIAWLARDTDAKPGRAAPSITADEVRPEHIRTRVAAQPGETVLIVRLRAFPGWHVIDNGRERRDLPGRNDGLLALPLLPGVPHRIDIRYAWTRDQRRGLDISIGAFFIGGVLTLGRRRRARSLPPQVSSRSIDDPLL